MFLFQSDKNLQTYNGKTENRLFSVSMGTSGFFTEIIIEYASTFHKTFVQIAEFDWLSGRQKGLIFEINIKNPHRNH